MWTRNIDTGKWSKQTDTLSKENYDDLKQDLQKVKLFSKCLSGSTYLPINDMGDIYSPLSINKFGFYINQQPLYSFNFPPIGPYIPLDTSNAREFYDKYLYENAFSVKNFFTPDKLINDQIKNYHEVDVATTELITSIGQQIPNLTIDGIRLIEGHRVLVKDQTSEVELAIGSDVEDYFTNAEQVSSYEEIEDNVTSKRYRFPNSENGIYKYENGTLVRDVDLEDYPSAYRYSVNVKMGDTNSGRQYHLSRLKGGYYPLSSENQNIEFLEKTNWVLRNRVDYNNQFDLNFYDSLHHFTQSYYDAELGVTYSIPERIITIGEFGSILINQNKLVTTATYSLSSLVFNKWKVYLKSISETERYYWICGHEGTLLKISKVNLEIERIDLGEVNNLLSISFYGNLNGMVVGEYNSIYYTLDGGFNWMKIDFPNFDIFSYNRVIHYDLTKCFIVGNNGLFLELDYVINEWVATRRRISKYINPNDEYILVDDIRDFTSVKIVNPSSMTYSLLETSQDFSESLIYNTTINSDNQIQISLDSQYFGSIVEIPNPIGLQYRISFQIEGSVSGIFYTSPNFNYVLPSPLPGTASWDIFQVDNLQRTRTFTYSLPLNSEGDVIDQVFTVRSNIVYNYDGVNFNPGLYQPVQPLEWNFTVTSGNYLCIVGNDNKFIVYDIESNLDSYSQFVFFNFSQSHSDIVAVSKSKNKPEVFIGGDNIYKVNLGDVLKVTSANNIVDSSSVLWATFFTNDILSKNDGTVISGNNSLNKFSVYATSSYVDLDPSFQSKLKSRLLMLDYDMASKLNFFTDNGEYRLPQSVTFSYGQTSSPIIISSIPNEYSFLDYYKDAEKTFRYFSSIQDSTAVKFSTTFTQSNSIATFSFVGSQITNSLSDIKPLAPNIDDETLSRYISNGSITTNYTTSFRVLIYKYLIIFRDMRNVSVGDVLYLRSNVVDTTLVVNRIESIAWSNHFGLSNPAVNYVYCYTEFNDNIIRNLKSSTSEITVVNLNKYRTIDQLLSNFDLHPASIGYKIEKNANVLTFTPRFNNKTAYYNLQSKVTIGTHSADMVYQESFLDFGYSPTYNIQDFLNKIDSNIFDPNMKFTILPEYYALPGNQGNNAASNNIYIDPVVGFVNLGTYSYYRSGTNKIIFGEDYKFHWESLLLFTFIDLDISTVSGGYNLEKLLIIKKYYDDSTGGWAMEFHKKIEIPSASQVISFTIRSRNTLSQVSSDLQILNNIQRTSITKSIQQSYTFTNLENELKSKFPTDSYFKVLASDWRIRRYTTGIIYTDYDYNISFNIFRPGEKEIYQIVNTSNQNSTLVNGFSDRLRIDLDSSHEFVAGDLVYLEFNGGSQSSEFLNPQYKGYHRVIESFSTFGGGWILTTCPYGQNITVTDKGILNFYRMDPFLNFQPIDIFKLGTDKKVTRSVEIKPDNFTVNGSTWSLINLDMAKFKFNLVDGLFLDEITTNYHWILEAEISNAVIGKNNSGIVWYSGDWLCGRWFGGTWISGRWVSGDWYGGVWNSLKTINRVTNVLIDTSNVDFRSSRWFNGRWFDGIWNGGTWFNGRKYAGTWVDGRWLGGIWNDGVWLRGRFEGGVWVLGTWESGIMNSDSKPLYWLDGQFKTGDFENGIWYNGIFGNDREVLTRFGTRSTNTRPSEWHGGTWLDGEFHSYLNTDSNTGLPIVSEIHKYSVWRTGNWLGGDFWGGIAYFINFKSGTWHGGILEDVQVVGVNALTPATQSTNSIVVNGIFRFNIGDEIWVIDNNRVTPYSPLGSSTTPRNYRVNFVQEDEVLDRTTIRLNYNLSTLGVDPVYASQSLVGYETGLRVVSYFKDSDWVSGIWTNGIFENGNIDSIIWYDGVFISGNWGN